MKTLVAPILVLLGFVIAIAVADENESKPTSAPVSAEAESVDAKSSSTASARASKPAPIARTGPKKRFPVRIDHGERKLHINGWGLCEWGIFGVDLYYCALHVESKSKSASVLLKQDQAYNIHLDFARDLTRKQMQKAYRTSIEVNTGKDIKKYRDRLAKLLAVMPAVEEGDDLHFRYLPEAGMTVLLNGKSLVTIPGADWGNLFLRLYVGSKPPTKDLRKGLLGS